MENKRILVIGGTGFIGKRLVKRMLDEGLNITLLVRQPSNLPGKYIVGDLLDRTSLKFKGFHLIVDLASVVRSFNKSRYHENVIGLSNLIDAMQKNRINSLIYFSSINAAARGYYGSSKWECEELIRKSALRYTILRPGYVFDIDLDNDFARLAKIIKLTHIAPIIGSGEYRFQPIFINDLIEIVLKIVKDALENPPGNSIIEIGGRDIVTTNKVVCQIQKNLGIKALSVHIPIALLDIFERFIPFDIKGYEEDKTIKNNCIASNNSFGEDLSYICYLVR